MCIHVYTSSTQVLQHDRCSPGISRSDTFNNNDIWVLTSGTLAVLIEHRYGYCNNLKGEIQTVCSQTAPFCTNM